MQYEQAYSFLIVKLENSLTAYLTYHNAQHTIDVIDAAVRLARDEGVDGNDLLLLKTAALFHDAGFLQDHEEHEKLGCKIARKHLPDFNYSGEQIDRICNMIMATRLPQSPSDVLSELLCDADLYYLGTDGYAAIAETLFHEFKKTRIVKTQTEWEVKHLEFFSSHPSFTRTTNTNLNNSNQ